MYRSFRYYLATASLIVLAACSGPQELPDNIAENQRAANAFGQKVFDAMPADAQRQVITSAEKIEQNLQLDFEKAKGDAHSATAIAHFADKRLADLQTLDSLLPKLGETLKRNEAEAPEQEGPAMHELTLRSAQRNLVVALRERQVQQRYLEIAIKADPMVAEAHRRWIADTKTQKTPLVRIVEGFSSEPCTFIASTKPGTGRFVMHGVALGMDRANAIAALCGAMNKDVTLLREDTQPTHLGHYDDLGFTPRRALSELPWTMTVPFKSLDIMELQNVRRELAKTYRASAKYCFDCRPETPGRRPDAYYHSAEIRFLPNGKVVRINIDREFGRRVAGNPGQGANSNWESTPQPLKAVLAPLQRQLGTPSFVRLTGKNPVVGWVFPDGRTSLPQEKWFFTPGSHGGGVSLQLNTPDLIRSGAHISREKLISANPRASYCMNRYMGSWGVENFFVYDWEWARNEAYITNRQAGKTVPNGAPVAYNTRYEAPGFIDRCGTIVLATFTTDKNEPEPGSSQTPAQSLSMDTPIYHLTVVMMDTDMARAGFVAEEKAVRSRVPAEAPRIVIAGSPIGDARTAKQQADRRASQDYGAWKTCLYKRSGNSFEYEDEVRCQPLDPQGRTPKQ